MPAPPYIPTLYTPLASHGGAGAMGGLDLIDLTTVATAPKQEQPAVSSDPRLLYPSEEMKRTERKAKIDARQKLTEFKQAHGYSESSEDETTLCPIREVPQLVPRSFDDQGRPTFETRTLFQHVPFTSSDILNWRANRPAWSEDPRGMANLVEGIIRTHNPSWVDLKQLLEALLTAEERVLLTQVGRQEAAKEHANSRSIDAVDVYQERVFPVREDPHWELNEPNGPGFRTGPDRQLVEQQLKMALELPMEEEWRLYSVLEERTDWEAFNVPEVWAEDNPPGLAKDVPPVIIELKPFANPVAIRQYRLPREAIVGIAAYLERLERYGILVPCQSPWNTPLLPIRKPDGSYRPVQDLRAVNKLVVPLHPVVPNPYTLLSLIPPHHQWFTVLDLKDAFFCIRLAEESQKIFAFQKEDPGTGAKGQLVWSRLPQGFCNSPTIFGQALAQDLLPMVKNDKGWTILQYVDDILLCADSREECLEGTQTLLQFLAEKGYKVSKKKAQLVQQEVKYLGFRLAKGVRRLEVERKEAICSIPTPRTRKQVREFLGAAGFCRIWIPNFGLYAKPLHEATKGKSGDPLVWGTEQQDAFEQLKKALMSAPALGLPDLDKTFYLYVGERKGVAVGVLTQLVGDWPRPVAYLSKQLDNVACGWPPCLRAVAAAAVLVEEANKLTLGQPE
ncbi:uncharacterized protein LOC134295916 [Anolis carolinensis]|uniref:uncharacterized protein LOC134295916 n=1 Tax=Anolis carolinensis TaxID=28377 RepID=UPI002F2B1A7A